MESRASTWSFVELAVLRRLFLRQKVNILHMTPRVKIGLKRNTFDRFVFVRKTVRKMSLNTYDFNSSKINDHLLMSSVGFVSLVLKISRPSIWTISIIINWNTIDRISNDSMFNINQ
jgi:hypothetical protein